MKVAVVDIETSPAVAYTFGTRNVFIGNEQIIQPTRTLCVGVKWLGKPVHVFSEWDFGNHQLAYGHEQMIMELWKVLDEADAIITYNGNSFDVPHLNREFLELGLTPPSPYFKIDLYQTVRSKFRFLSGKLDYVVKTLELGGKAATGGFSLWADVMDGDDKAQDRMSRYCAQDVKITEKLYYELRPWISNHPNEALFSGKPHVCPTCGSASLQKRGVARTKVSVFQQYQCNDCGTYSRSGKRLDGVDIRQVR